MVLVLIPDAHFIIIGDGELSEDLHHLAKSLVVENNLFFIEPQTKIVDYYSIMSLFVSSSLWEGLPMYCSNAWHMVFPSLAQTFLGQMK